MEMWSIVLKYNAQKEAEMKLSCIKLQRKKEHVYVNGARIMAVVSIYKSCLTMEETLPDKRILEKLKGKGKGLAFYTTTNKLKS
jgi:hypothetical protein